jgi:DNA-binding response OmpR family regulator
MTVNEAKHLLRKIGFSVLICDIGLPDGTGWDLGKELKSSDRRIFGIAMSGFGTNADSVRSKESGFQYHLLKPFKPAELDRLLAKAASECCTVP